MRIFAKTSILALLLLIATAAFTGCRTAHGFGEDMEHAGQHLQDKSE